MEINPNLSEKGKHDYKLVLLALKGNEKAYAELLDRYKDAIYYMLLKKNLKDYFKIDCAEITGTDYI